MNFYGRNKRKLVRDLKSLSRNVIMQVPFPVPLIINNCCLLHISIAFPPPPLPQHFCFPSSSNYTLSILNRPYMQPTSTLHRSYIDTTSTSFTSLSFRQSLFVMILIMNSKATYHHLDMSFVFPPPP